MALAILSQHHRPSILQLLEHGGASALYKILTTLVETNIVGRTARVVANAAQDDDFRLKLLNAGVLGALVKNLAEVNAPAAKSSIIRALRLIISIPPPRCYLMFEVTFLMVFLEA